MFVLGVTKNRIHLLSVCGGSVIVRVDLWELLCMGIIVQAVLY